MIQRKGRLRKAIYIIIHIMCASSNKSINLICPAFEKKRLNQPCAREVSLKVLHCISNSNNSLRKLKSILAILSQLFLHSFTFCRFFDSLIEENRRSQKHPTLISQKTSLKYFLLKVFQKWYAQNLDQQGEVGALGRLPHTCELSQMYGLFLFAVWLPGQTD